MIAERDAVLSIADGPRLQARLALPEPPSGGVVVCHPHPLYGGDMDNPVVVRVAEVCSALGLATLRFNFRGVGGSTGAHDEGRGERLDVETALAHLAGLIGPTPLALAGYSFGAALAATLAAGRRDLAGLALVAPPLAMREPPGLPALAGFPGPVLLVAGTADEHCPPDALERFRAAAPRAVIRTIPGANHFFFGKLFPLGEAVEAWARQVLGTGGPG
jgi:alpha/beta superfamily hydrolase